MQMVHAAMRPAIRAVIFDLDGVIVSTDFMHYRAWKSIADDEGIHFDEEKNDRLRGVSRMDSLEIILEGASRDYSSIEKEQLAETKNSRYIELLRDLTPDDVPAEVLRLIAHLKEAGIKVAVGSSSKNAPMILKQIGLSEEFDVVVDGNAVKRAKPAPDLFLAAARQLAVRPEECLVVEDAPAGIEAAKAAGMLAAATGPALLCDDADYKLKEIGRLVEVVLSVD